MPRTIRLTLVVAVAVSAFGLTALPASAADAGASQQDCVIAPAKDRCQEQAQRCQANPSGADCKQTCDAWGQMAADAQKQLNSAKRKLKSAKRKLKKAKTRGAKRRARKQRKKAKALVKTGKEAVALENGRKPGFC